MTTDAHSELLKQLTELGFSQYEARAYEGLLLAGDAQTGYGLSKTTGMPQAKVYETLGRLARRGAAVQVSNDPARFVATPAEQLLSKLADDFQRNLESARRALHELDRPQGYEWPHVAWRLDSQEEILDRAVDALFEAEEKVYLSVKTGDLGRLVDAVHDASMRGVDFVVLHFGSNPFPDLRGSSYQHLSTEGHLYPRHQAQHLAMVVDTERCLWGLALNGRQWSAITAEDPTMARAIKSYIRHDIYVQRIFADFHEELTERYGPALEQLADLTERTAKERTPRDDRRAG
jgi:HTH-type transcriptional regulator, sugar sensing transcriptional regulator